MKCDWELVRQILKAMEAMEGGPLQPGDVLGGDEATVSYHLRIMGEAGLIQVKCVGTGARLHCMGVSLTWAGHEFLDAIAKPDLWNRIKGVVREKGLDLSFDVVKAAAKAVIETALKG